MKLVIFLFIFSLPLCLKAQSEMDSISLWKYEFDKNYTGFEGDLTKSVGKITFKRIKGIEDNLSLKLYNHLWFPSIDFSIYNLSDIEFVNNESRHTHLFSSCVFPEVGGDIFIVEDLILLNRSVCLDCQNNQTKIEYCRPIVKFIISKIDRSKVHSVDDLVGQLIIEKIGHKKASR